MNQSVLPHSSNSQNTCFQRDSVLTEFTRRARVGCAKHSVVCEAPVAIDTEIVFFINQMLYLLYLIH